MSLQNELDAFKQTWIERVGPETAQMMADDNASLVTLVAKARKAGDDFPDVPLADHLGRTVRLAALADERPLVVTVYRGGWCPYCNMQLRAYQKVLPEIEAAGARLIAVSPEAPDNTLTTAEKNGLTMTVLSDLHGRLADALGIRFELSEPVKAYFVKAGHDLPARNADDKWSLPIPSTYVVARGGRIVFAHIETDYRKRLEPEDLVAALERLAEQAEA